MLISRPLAETEMRTSVSPGMLDRVQEQLPHAPEQEIARFSLHLLGLAVIFDSDQYSVGPLKGLGQRIKGGFEAKLGQDRRIQLDRQGAGVLNGLLQRLSDRPQDPLRLGAAAAFAGVFRP